MRKRIFLTALLFGLYSIYLLISSCNSNHSGANSSDKLSGKITISGAFALYPLTVKWSQEFLKIHPNVTINISAGEGLVDHRVGQRILDGDVHGGIDAGRIAGLVVLRAEARAFGVQRNQRAFIGFGQRMAADDEDRNAQHVSVSQEPVGFSHFDRARALRRQVPSRESRRHKSCVIIHRCSGGRRGGK